MYTTLTTDEICNILVALRLAQRDPHAFYSVAEEMGIIALDISGIDNLCEALNTSHTISEEDAERAFGS